MSLLFLWMLWASQYWTALLDPIHYAVVVGDVDRLAECRDRLSRGLVEGVVTESVLRNYTLAYVNWRLAYLPRHEKSFDRKELLKEAEFQLQKVIESEPRNAEAYALLGAVYGGQIMSNWKKLTEVPGQKPLSRRLLRLSPITRVSL